MTEAEVREFSRVVAQDVPANEELSWSFADEDHWIDVIDRLSAKDVAELCKAEVISGKERTSVFEIARSRVCAAMEEVKGRFLKRNCAIEMMVACAIAQTNLVFLGRPGTAKSLIVRAFAQSLGMRPNNVPIKQENREVEALVNLASQRKKDADKRKENDERLSKGLPPLHANEVSQKLENKASRRQKRRFFEYLLTRYTTPEELFGGTDIEVLLQTGVFCRRTDGMLPQAEIAFLDEIFKANGAILNALLSLVNERIFYNMGRAFKVNMAFVVGASNETPDIDELGALYDRFPIRVPVFNVSDSEDDLKELLKKSHHGECSERLHLDLDVDSEIKARITRKACLNDVRLLSKYLLGAAFGGMTAFRENDKEFRRAFDELFLVTRHDYGVSDRTPAQVLRVCRALALLDRNANVDAPLAMRHLRAWGYVAPDIEEQITLQKYVETVLAKKGVSAVNLFERI